MAKVLQFRTPAVAGPAGNAQTVTHRPVLRSAPQPSPLHRRYIVQWQESSASGWKEETYSYALPQPALTRARRLAQDNPLWRVLVASMDGAVVWDSEADHAA